MKKIRKEKVQTMKRENTEGTMEEAVRRQCEETGDIKLCEGREE